MAQIHKITEEQLFDYINCPVLYAIKYNNSRIKVEKPVSMNRLLNRVVNNFCLKLMQGEVMPFGNFKRKWDMFAKKYPTVIDQHRIREGYGLLNSFYAWAEERELRIADIGHNYMIRFIHDNEIYEYYGALGIIAASKNGKPENLKFDFALRVPEQTNADISMKTTLDHIGFQQLYNQPLESTHIHHVRKDRDIFTTRDYNTYIDKAKAVIVNVVKSINSNIWYPHETPLCTSCGVKNFCTLYGVKY